MTTVTQPPNLSVATTVTTDLPNSSTDSSITQVMSSTSAKGVRSWSETTVTADFSASTSSGVITSTMNSIKSTTGLAGASTISPESTSSFKTNNYSASTMNTTLFCPEPSTITGGNVISRGPYIANISSAVFSCYAGYSMSGSGQVACNSAGLWASKMPQCVPINNNPVVHNLMTFNQNPETVPFWLILVLAVSLGILCLLLLTCLLLYCLKLFGCWNGRLCFRSNFGTNRRVHDSETFWDDYGRRDAYRPKRVSYEEELSNIRPKRNSSFGTQTNATYKEPTPAAVSSWDVGKLRREAKMPAKKTWMPHVNSVRQYNTSTK